MHSKAVGLIALTLQVHRFVTSFGGTVKQQAVSMYVTDQGERANIVLPDGNTVALNVASRLEVPADYLAGDHALRF